MNSALCTTLLLAIASTCIEAEAKPLERCILALEARPTNAPAPGDSPRTDRFGKPCPLAIVYPGGGEAARPAARPRAVRPLAARPPMLAPIAADEGTAFDDPTDGGREAARDAVAPPRTVLHV